MDLLSALPKRNRWDTLDRSVRLEMKIGLAVAAAGLITMVYALTQGKLWSAGLLALNVGVILMSYRREKQLERQP